MPTDQYEEFPWDYDEADYDEDGDEDPEADCGRWDNGRLMGSCSLAGTEHCDFECPLRDR